MVQLCPPPSAAGRRTRRRCAVYMNMGLQLFTFTFTFAVEAGRMTVGSVSTGARKATVPPPGHRCIAGCIGGMAVAISTATRPVPKPTGNAFTHSLHAPGG